MPSAAAHRECAQHNEEFVEFLGGAKTAWPRWVATAIFYAALHWVDSFLVVNKTPAQDHSDRNHKLLQWPEIRKPYMRLLQLSHDARYRIKDPTQMQLQGALLLLDMVKKEVKNEVEALVKAQQAQSAAGPGSPQTPTA